MKRLCDYDEVLGYLDATNTPPNLREALIRQMAVLTRDDVIQDLERKLRNAIELNKVTEAQSGERLAALTRQCRMQEQLIISLRETIAELKLVIKSIRDLTKGVWK
jgi:hypothetical protein